MRKRFGFLAVLAVFLVCATPNDYGQGGGRPIPPGIRDADKQGNAPIDAPAKPVTKSIDAAAVKQEADELARLSAAIPSQVNQVAQGQLPKDLADQLKRIEKLAKHLRSEVTP
jgi:hypothetical protein